MPKPKQFTYTKKPAFRDASFFIIICEGESREPEYFRFFDGISSRVKVVSVASISGNSSPSHLVANAIQTEQELEVDKAIDTIWFVIDTDKWQVHIHELRRESEMRSHWQIVQSNPCFEVWLYFHAKTELADLTDITQCNKWKALLPTIVKGGFNSDFHPIAIETAIANSKASYEETGYTPKPGSTQIWRLGESLLPSIQKNLGGLKGKFPVPQIIE